MNVCVRGPLLSISGYGYHAREVYRWLSSKADMNLSTQILPWGITPWYINPDLENGLIGKIMSQSIEIDKRGYDVSFQIQLPNEWDAELAKFNVGVTAAVETDICSPAWVAACNQMDLVVVPSLHTKKTIENSGALTTPVVVIPESFPDDFLSDTQVDLVLPLRTSFNFLIFGQLTGNNAFIDRKNTFFALKWLCEEFADDPDVGIILKTNHGRNTSSDRKFVHQVVQQVSAEINSNVPIYLLHGAMTDKEIKALFENDNVKALVSPTRGEGFGRSLLESAACGVPVLATNWSSHLDFLNKGKWVKFDYTLTEIPQQKVDGQIFLAGSKWAEVNESDFKKKVRKFRQKPGMPQKWADDLKGKILESYSFDVVAKQWEEVASEYIK
jgi:glycosyltransferase involved in cell wall biosynthesis